MAFEITFGIFVTDRDKYDQYRTEMTPLLERAGGTFRYDFEVARTLKSEADHDINRVFVMRFPQRSDKERFFSDSQYLEIRKRLFEKSVSAVATIAECG